MLDEMAMLNIARSSFVVCSRTRPYGAACGSDALHTRACCAIRPPASRGAAPACPHCATRAKYSQRRQPCCSIRATAPGSGTNRLLVHEPDALEDARGGLVGAQPRRPDALEVDVSKPCATTAPAASVA
ncbi:MAG: hypothetical protein U1F45_17755 [Burkholderiales bacterium]